MNNSPAKTKEHYIELFRKNGFNCFPITRYHESIPNQKQDSRYKAERTPVNQSIKHNENYGVLLTKEGKNCIIDFDNKVFIIISKYSLPVVQTFEQLL